MEHILKYMNIALFNCMYKISPCRIVLEFILGAGQLDPKIYLKKSSRAAKAHVCILARTHTAKTAISTKLNR